MMKKVTANVKMTSFLLGLALLLLIAPFYSQVNGGGSGLSLTYNIPTWVIASWIIAVGLWLIANNKTFTYPQLWYYFVVFPVITLASSMLAEISQPINWLFRQLVILGGFFFLFALFQYQAKQYVLDRILLVLVLTAGLHALLGSMQIIAPDHLPAYFPPNNDFVPRGMFQQINVQVSFLVTGLVICLYLISRPSFRLSSPLVKFLVIIAFTLAVYVIIASGSRVGLLSILLSVPLVLWSRRQQLRPQKNLLIILFVISCGSVWAGQSGLQQTMDKTVRATDNSYATARVAMYTIGLELVVKEPVHGYGIGGFLKAWNQQSSDFVSRHPETVLPPYITHPHNELLFWMIEGGLLVLAGILIVIVGIILALYRCGFQRGGAYAAMLIPISLHTQVELPFYISAVHWFLWLFLIYLVLRHSSRTINVTFSAAVTWSLRTVAVIFAIGVTLFMINTARAQADLYSFLHDRNKQPPYLQLALNNLYFKPVAEQLAMRSMLYASIENNDRARVKIFETWAQEYVEINPELKMYEDLISASVFLRPEGKGCDAIKDGLTMYAHNKPLQQAYKDKCSVQD